MKYLVAMFNSRTDTMRFYNMLKNYNGFCSVINTPHSLSRSCGISVKISNNQLTISQQIIKNNNFISFKGIFEINSANPNIAPKRVY